MKLSRRQIREHVFRLVFLSEFYEDGSFEGQVDGYLDAICAETPLNDDDRQTIRKRAIATAGMLKTLDADLNRLSEGWKTDRMSRVDLAIMRLAVMEMKYDDTIPYKVSINEAVELAKTYGGHDSPGYVNAVLGKLAREL